MCDERCKVRGGLGKVRGDRCEVRRNRGEVRGGRQARQEVIVP
jgi:hypothetical protein